MPPASAALELTRGDQVLAVCHGCSFVFNTAFDAGPARLLGRTRGVPGFLAGVPRLRYRAGDGLDGALRPRRRAGRRDRLRQGRLPERAGRRAGVGRAHGVDPGIDLERLPEGGQVTGERAYYAPSELSRAAVAIACRHTLEHIPDSTDFIADVVAGVDPERCRALLFEVPDLTRVLTEAAFWDLQYEHCSSFTAGALEALFERHGLEVLDLRLVYGGQYLIIEADPHAGTPHARAVRTAGAGRARSSRTAMRSPRRSRRSSTTGRRGSPHSTRRAARRSSGAAAPRASCSSTTCPTGSRAPRGRHQQGAARRMAGRRRRADRRARGAHGRPARHRAADERGLPRRGAPHARRPRAHARSSCSPI